MSTPQPIVGVILPVVDLVLTLPTVRKDGSALKPDEIQSVTVLRNTGTGPAKLKVLPGPFNGATALYSDDSPLTGNDIYSFYVTDKAGTDGDTSTPIMVTVEGKRLSAPAAATLTAIAKADPKAKPLDKPETEREKAERRAPEGAAKFSATGWTPAPETPSAIAETPAPVSGTFTTTPANK